MASLKQLSSESNLKSWACLVCTFLNDASLVNCEMCTTKRTDNEDSEKEVNKRTKINTESASSSSRPSHAHVGPAAFIAALASLSPSTSALNSSPPLVYGSPPGRWGANSLNKRSFGAGVGKIRMLSWNTDGIFDKGFCKERAVQASELIINESPDVILLQELVPESFNVFRAKLESAGYVTSLPSQPHPAPYFCGIFTSNCLTVKECSQTPFKCGSYMYRDLSYVAISGGPLLSTEEGASSSEGGATKRESKIVHIYTSHLESMKSEGVIGSRSQDYRIKQLLETTTHLLDHAGIGQAALFAGDTNLRNDEVVSPRASVDVNLSPSYDAAFRPKKTAAIVDSFEQAGEPNKHKFTWDCLLNDNLGMADFKPRARYDRCFMTRDLLTVCQDSFHLVGTSKFMLPSTGDMMFPSDHFGICMDLDVV